MPTILMPLFLLTAVLSGAIFGFFYTWSFVVMRGLSAADPRAAIDAMNAVNANIQNGWFAAIFFGAPLATALAAAASFAAGGRASAVLMGLATLVYAAGCVLVTLRVNVPMNDALALVEANAAADPAGIWRDHAGPWTRWNHLRTAACGGSFALALLALRSLRL